MIHCLAIRKNLDNLDAAGIIAFNLSSKMYLLKPTLLHYYLIVKQRKSFS